MNAFRQALEAHLNGQLALETVEDRLHESLATQPLLASAHAAVIEALYRSDRIAGPTYLALREIIQAFQKPLSDPQNPVSGFDKTRLRPPRDSGDTQPGYADKTRIRPSGGNVTTPTIETTSGSSWSNPLRWLTDD